MYKLKLNETTDVKGKNIEILRVPGGWVYTSYSQISDSGYNISSTFVPYSEEFKVEAASC